MAALIFFLPASLALASQAGDLTCVNDRAIKRSELPAPNREIAKFVTLEEIKKIPGLAEKLQSFFDGHEWKDKSFFINKLHGRRKDLSKCWSLMSSTIDVAGCEATKEAGEARLQIENGRPEFFVDTDNESVTVPVPLTNVCTDGKKTFSFKFLYYKQFGPDLHRVTAGPWEYTVAVSKGANGMTSSTKVREIIDDQGKGPTYALHSAAIKVDPLITGGHSKDVKPRARTTNQRTPLAK